MRTLCAVLAVLAIAGTIAVSAPWSSSARPGTRRSTYEPVLDPANFTTTIDNQYFPLPVGRTLIYRASRTARLKSTE
jgi:hypothetical protein